MFVQLHAENVFKNEYFPITTTAITLVIKIAITRSKWFMAVM